MVDVNIVHVYPKIYATKKWANSMENVINTTLCKFSSLLHTVNCWVFLTEFIGNSFICSYFHVSSHCGPPPSHIKYKTITFFFLFLPPFLLPVAQSLKQISTLSCSLLGCRVLPQSQSEFLTDLNDKINGNCRSDNARPDGTKRGNIFTFTFL